MDKFPVFQNFLSTKYCLTVNHGRDYTVWFVNSFTVLLDTYNEEINDFVKSTHATNSAHPANGKILIPESAIVALKVFIFELGDSSRCGSLPVLAKIQVLETVQINYMRVQRTKAVAEKANFATFSKLPEITVPELTADNYEIFITAFCSI